MWCYLSVHKLFIHICNILIFSFLMDLNKYDFICSCRWPWTWNSYFEWSSDDKTYVHVFMPPPLGAGGIIFSGCPSVPPSVRPSEAWNTLFWPVHGSVGPPDQPLPFYGMSVRPSGEVSGHFPDNALRDWPEIWHADVSWPPSELISLWPWSVNFSNFGTILT